ncbi:DMT family transporter [Actinoallomurus purpureus]|uniref:EamA family transporter n=1 Tax=Actinoallomurus purpureus TaxID=478114 RepID=UPI002091F0EF|nr:DMT family transporter [Actinoallomurus purpureus]MCO6007223.1 DMT family transporter [Actinoallomurus purpureus]
MIVVLALLSAIAFGAGDFCGGSASRRIDDLRVLLVSLPAGLCLLLPVAAFGGHWHAEALGWGAASGIAGGCGLLVFYRALAMGPMSVVAPVSGLMAAVVPAAVGIARGDRLSLTTIAGIVLCLVAICFVSVERGAGPIRLTGGPVLAAVAGTCFGLFFVIIHLGDDGTLWPLAASKASGLAVVLVVAVVTRRGPLPLLKDRGTLGVALLAGGLDMLGNALYVFAARAGTLSVAGVLSSLYPASTVLLARLVYGERLRPVQRVGLVIAVAGVSLVTTG